MRDMHQWCLVHRDLKPLNIFLSDVSDMPQVKIGDLGFAALLKPGQKLTKRVGTKGFTAPEVAKE